MAVERSRWTDERLDELAERVMRGAVLEARFDSLERGFVDVRSELRDMRAEMRETHADLTKQFDGLRGEMTGQIDGLRGEVTGQIDGLRGEVTGLRRDLYDTRRWLLTMWATGSLALLAVFVEVSLRM